MTIRRRLLITNILMIIFPILITAITYLGVRSIIVGDDTLTRGGVFGERFADMPQIPVVSAYEAEEAFGRGDFAYITSDVSMFRSDLGDYIIIVADNYRQSVYGFHNPPMRMYISIAMVYLLIVIVLANILLAKYITRRITSPIDILARGVDEISVGNLTHRIEYSKGDEFDAVCASFNEMAERLHSMVQQRQADEKNRRELIAGISHDLRTPLTSVKAYIEGLRKGVATTPEKQEKYLSTIQSKTEDIEYIITQLFTFSKIDTGEFPFNLEVVDIACELAKVMDVAEGVEASHVLVDVVQFRNVLENIHSNSVKYSGREDVKVLASCEKQGDDMVITIADNGVGVPDEMLTKIFDVFVRGDESRNNPAEGSGLGLAISAKIIERLGGTIRAENVAEGGLAVIITLPIHKGV